MEIEIESLYVDKAVTDIKSVAKGNKTFLLITFGKKSKLPLEKLIKTSKLYVSY